MDRSVFLDLKKCTSFLFIICFLSLLHGAQISIDLSGLEKDEDRQGNFVPTAYVGETFTIKVIVFRSGRDTSEVTIDGIDNFQVVGTSQSTSVSFINGSVSSEITYLYDVVAQQQGRYKLGPAYIEEKGNRVASDSATIQILPPSAAPQRSQTTKHQDSLSRPEVFCELDISKTRSVVGEQLEAVVRIYIRGEVANLQFATPPTFPGFLTKEIPDARQRRVEYKGKAYELIEKRFIISPLQEGEKKLEPIKVVYAYREKRKRKRNRNVFFNDPFFDVSPMRKAVVASKPLSITVDRLPSYERKIDGVGEFTRFSVTFDKKEATINEPVVMRFELTGIANLDHISDVNLSLPSGIKWYKSKTDTKQDSLLGGTKIFEYIVQVPRAGIIEFKPQSFTFFDVESRAFKTLESNALVLKVLPAPDGQGAIPSAPLTDQEIKTDEIDATKENIEKVEEIHFIEEDALSTKKTAPSLPLWAFVLLLLLPILLVKGVFSKKLQSIFSGKYFDKKSLARFEQDLEILLKKESAKNLYQFFMAFFATKFLVDQEEVTERLIEKRLNEQGLQPVKIDEFLDYLNECASLHFASQDVRRGDQMRLLKGAQYWFLVVNK